MSLKNRSFLKLLDYTPAEIEELLDLAESERYNKIVKDWVKKKPLYERQIQQLNDKIFLFISENI